MHSGLEVTLPIQVTQSFLLTSESFCCSDTPLEHRAPREGPPPPQPLTPTHSVLSFLLWGPAPEWKACKGASDGSLYGSLGEQESLALTHHGVSQGFSLGCEFYLFCCFKTRHSPILCLTPAPMSLLTILCAGRGREMREIITRKMISYGIYIIQSESILHHSKPVIQIEAFSVTDSERRSPWSCQ